MKQLGWWLVGLVLAGWLLSACSPKPLLQEVSVRPELITPNADGRDDLAKIEFRLNRSATVAIYFYDANGQRFIFRAPTPLGLSEKSYTVFFPGVVEGFTLPAEPPPEFTILKRTLPNGRYTWEIVAETPAGERAVVTGTLTVQEADTQLPAIRGFAVYPKEFSPNQDGIDDRVTLNLDLKKDVEELLVYLRGADGTLRHIPEKEQTTPLNQAGWHTFDYDGGIDSGAEPPPDGEYVVYAEARDKVGQRVIVTDTVRIVNAGLPSAYILNGEVEYSATSLVLSDTLCFTLTVENDSNTYLRTTGPWPGTTYRGDQNFNTLGYSEESGVFRVALNYDTSLRDYPYRWGIGTPGKDLVQIGEYWYLPPFKRTLVTGCVQIVEVPRRNPLYYWAGLIHEDVRIASVNNRVDPRLITIWQP